MLFWNKSSESSEWIWLERLWNICLWPCMVMIKSTYMKHQSSYVCNVWECGNHDKTSVTLCTKHDKKVKYISQVLLNLIINTLSCVIDFELRLKLYTLITNFCVFFFVETLYNWTMIKTVLFGGNTLL